MSGMDYDPDDWRLGMVQRGVALVVLAWEEKIRKSAECSSPTFDQTVV